MHGPPGSGPNRPLPPYLVISHFYTHCCLATTNQLLPTLYTGISYPYLCLCSCFFGLGHSPSKSSRPTLTFFQRLAQTLLNPNEIFLDSRSHRKSFLQMCGAFFSLSLLIYFSLSMFILSLSVHRTLAPSSSRVTSHPGSHCHAQEKHPKNGADCTELQGPTEDPSIRGLPSTSSASDQLLEQCLA